MKEMTKCDKKCPFNTKGKCSQEMNKPMFNLEENGEIFCCQEEHCTGGIRKVVLVSCGLVYSLNEEGYLLFSGNWDESFLIYMEDRCNKELSEEDKAFILLLREAYACPKDKDCTLMPAMLEVIERFREPFSRSSFGNINVVLKWAGLPKLCG